MGINLTHKVGYDVSKPNWWEEVEYENVFGIKVPVEEIDWDAFVFAGNTLNSVRFENCPYPYVLSRVFPAGVAYIVTRDNAKDVVAITTDVHRFVHQHKTAETVIMKDE